MSRHQRLAFALFAVYLLCYGGFVLVSAFSPLSMEQIGPAGLNLAILWGFGLIVLAFVLALIYGIFAGGSDDAPARKTDEVVTETTGTENGGAAQ